MGGRVLAAEGVGWAVATPHVAATEAAADAFAEGGNAVDAALAAAIALAVVYPHMCGVGGDMFALVQVPNGQAVAINSSGAAPAAIEVERIRAADSGVPEYGPDSITVPGAVAGWAELHAEGATIPWERLFDRPAALAREGVPVARSLAGSLAEYGDRLAGDPGMRETYLSAGVPALGSRLTQPALARTLEAIAKGGAGAFYGGELGAAYADGLRRAGSAMTREDLAAHRTEVVPPLQGPFRDLDVLVAPPNSQGFVLLEMLHAIEHRRIDPDPLGPDAGAMARIFGAASADRDRHNADPRLGHVALATLLDEGHIAAIADEALDPSVHAGAASPSLSGDTIALVTADADGRGVSLIQSLSSAFGSGICEPITGITAHNRGACFTLDPESENVLAPRKRPAHTLMPVLARRGDRLAAVSGTMGSYAQPQINASSLLRSFALGLTPAETLEAPRWLVNGMDPWSEPPWVEAESRVPAATLDALGDAGFEIRLMAPLDEGAGHAHLIHVRDDGSFAAASDPRADGSAAAG